jgi:uncharacterized membrane protein
VKRFLPHILLVLVGVLAGYYLTLVVAPYAVLYVFEHKLLAKVAENEVYHATLPASTPKTGTMPNPDFLYSILKYNLSGGPIRLTGLVPHDTYWSFSAYQANSSNFYVVNDGQITGDKFDFVLAKSGESLANYQLPSSAKIIYSPSATGVGLFRLLASIKLSSAQLETLRHQTQVQILKNGSL